MGQTLHFYLEPTLLDSARAGAHNFIARIADVARQAGMEAVYHGNGPAERAAFDPHAGRAMFHMEQPWAPGGLTFRRVYHYPFWGIEPTAERWRWHVAQAPFDGQRIDRREAARFARYWRERLFGAAALAPRRDGFIYVPLQGRLLDHRSFQSAAPIDMLRAVLAADPRPVVAALHPKESYGPDELAALAALEAAHPRLEVTLGRMVELLAACDVVVTENSGAAFNGYFFGKPAVLFAGADFHHIALKPGRNLADTLRAARDHAPDYDGYLWWFWQEMSINAGRPEAEAKIIMALRRGGWIT